MKSQASLMRPTTNVAPGVGGSSIQFFDDRFHKEMLRDVKSRVGTQFNDTTWQKRKSNLSHFKRDQGLSNLRQIDKKNLQMFLRLSSVQPSVPVVVKRSVQQQIDIKPIRESEQE